MTKAYALHKRLTELLFEMSENNSSIRRMQEDNRAAQIEYNEVLREYKIARARIAGEMCLYCERPAVKRGLCEAHALEVFGE